MKDVLAAEPALAGKKGKSSIQLFQIARKACAVLGTAQAPLWPGWTRE